MDMTEIILLLIIGVGSLCFIVLILLANYQQGKKGDENEE